MAPAAPRAHTTAASADESRTAPPLPKSCMPLCLCSWSSRFTHVAPHLRAHVFGLHLRQFPQQLPRALIVHIRRAQNHFHNFIAARVLARIQYALLAQPEFLAVLCPLRDLQNRAPVNGRHFDLGAQSRLRNRQRHLDVDVVSIALEEWMLLHANCDIKVARRPARHAGISLPRYPQPRPRRHALRNPHLYRVRPRHHALAPARRACVLQPPRSAAARARQVELHRPRHLRHRSRPIALRTDRHIISSRTRAVARLACLLPRDIQLHLRPSNRLPEIDVQPILEVRSALRLRSALPGAAAIVEKLTEDVAESEAFRFLRPAPCAALSPGLLLS